MIWILATLLVALLVLQLTVIVLDRYRRKLERSYVKVGDLWEYAAPDTHPKRKTRGLYEVVRANVNTEAGADSWVMRNCSTGTTLYMHHRQRTEPNSPWILATRDGRPMRTERDVKRSLAAGPMLALAMALTACPPAAPIPSPTQDAGPAPDGSLPGCTDGVDCACARLRALDCAGGGDGCEAAFQRIMADRMTWVDLECISAAQSKEAERGCAGIGERDCP